jgi:hypothetical protein
MAVASLSVAVESGIHDLDLRFCHLGPREVPATVPHVVRDEPGTTDEPPGTHWAVQRTLPRESTSVMIMVVFLSHASYRLPSMRIDRARPCPTVPRARSFRDLCDRARCPRSMGHGHGAQSRGVHRHSEKIDLGAR